MKLNEFHDESDPALGMKADQMHADHEIQMARADCYKIAKYAIDLHNMLKDVPDSANLEGWVQKKITIAAEYMGSVKHYLEYEKISGSGITVAESKRQGVAEGLNEFAPPSSSDGDDGFSEETLKQLAAQWFNGDEDPKVERTLAAAGWEIGQDEGYDDEPGVFVVQSGDINGDSYLSWPANELRQGVAEAPQDPINYNAAITGSYYE